MQVTLCALIAPEKSEAKKSLHLCRLLFMSLSGSTTWTRTRDPMINSHLLYQLSYCGIGAYVTDSKREVKHRV